MLWDMLSKMESEKNALRKLAALLVEFWLRWFELVEALVKSATKKNYR